MRSFAKLDGTPFQVTLLNEVVYVCQLSNINVTDEHWPFKFSFWGSCFFRLLDNGDSSG